MKDEGREGKRRKEGVRVWLGGERERERGKNNRRENRKSCSEVLQKIRNRERGECMVREVEREREREREKRDRDREIQTLAGMVSVGC